MSFGEQLQIAIYDRLSSYSPLLAIATVYDNPPQNTEFPYVAIGDDILTSWSGDDFVGAQGEISIHTWSRHQGRLQTKQIQGLIFDALSRYELAISGYTLITLEWSGAETLIDTDGKTRHGVSTFDVIFL